MEQVKHCIAGKGNDGMYIDRFPKIYAAGIRSLQPNERVSDCFNECVTQDVPIISKQESTAFELLKPIGPVMCEDMRNAGPFTESSQLINPPVLTKFQTLVEDLKCTVYKSYWHKCIGKGTDFTSLPPNVDIKKNTFGKKTRSDGNLYSIILPNRCSTPEKRTSQAPGYQSTRNYCSNSFNLNIVHGIETDIDKNGKLMKCCMTEERIFIGTSLKQPILSAQQNFQKRTRADLGTCLTPNNCIELVPAGHVFGKVEPKKNSVAKCLSYCQLNPERELFYKCLSHLNTVRKCLSKKFNGTFFRNMYLQFRYLDNSLSGWLSKEIVYKYCTTKYIRFTPRFIEFLLKMWKAFNDIDIEYKTFINIINFREPLPEFPKVQGISPECTNFSTTYKEMVTPQQASTMPMAGIPSGRYFDRVYPVRPDGCCKADTSYLPEESDARACLCPSIFNLLGISHRDMYTERDPDTVKRVFEAAGEDFTQSIFDDVWSNAMKHHSKGLVCYETFRLALKEYKNKLTLNI